MKLFIYLSIIVLAFMTFSCEDGTTPQRERTTCVGVDCGEGECKVLDNKAVCDCNTGYHKMGLSCEENGSSCVGVDCGNGSCDIKDGKAVCNCLTAYSGAECDTCAEGFQDNDNNEICERTCVSSGIDCGEYGSCDDTNGTVSCTCENGYNGALCSVFEGSKLTLKITDQWGRAIDFDKFTVTMTKDEEAIDMDSFDFNYNLLDLGDYTLTLTSEDYFPLEFKFKYIGENIENGIKDIELINNDNSDAYPVTKHAFVYFKEEPNNMIPNWHHKFYIGVAHKWFAPTGSPFSKNKIELYTNGEDAWNNIADDLDNATSEINAVSWTYESDFTLRHPIDINADRAPFRVTNMLNQGGSVKTRVILAQLWGQDSWLTNWQNNGDLKDRAEDASDNFEFMAQANPTTENYTIFFNDASLSQRLMEIDKDFRFKFPNSFIEEQYIQPIICGSRDEAGKCKFNYAVDLHGTFDLELNIASYHQKFFLMDRKIAYVGGMNMAEEYWDTEEHGVFEHRRMKYNSDNGDREEVKNGDNNGIKTPSDISPYKDYFTKIEGPLVKDVYDIFTKRWNHLIHSRVNYSENSTIIEQMENYLPEVADGINAQITVTMPRPFQENTILESHLLAIRQAKHYIFIEDQYFRMPIVNQMISVRMNEVPDLKLIVITQPISYTGEWTDLGCFWTSTSYKLFMDNFPNRTAFFQLKSFDYTYPDHDCTGYTESSCYGDEMEGYFKSFYVHSKMVIIDDKYMSIGSANKNNRGFVYEGEMNIAIVDEAWVTEKRKKIFKTILGSYYSDVEAWGAADFGNMFNKLKEIAVNNQNTYEEWDGWDDNNGSDHMDIDLDIDYTSVTKENALPDNYKPKGLLYPLSFPEPSDCNLENIGPDAAK